VGDHPVKVPPELVEFVVAEAADLFPEDEGDLVDVYAARDEHLANYFAQWGADQELEACCDWLGEQGFLDAYRLRAARRPKPPTLAEQATTALHAIASGANDAREQCHDIATITAALNRLAELEAKQ
jgi:hypothetical protein